MVARRVSLVYSPGLASLSYPDDCPFKTYRATRLRDLLQSLRLLSGPNREEREPAPAERLDLERFHAPSYLDEIERAASGDLTVDGLHMGLGSPDCPVFPDMYECARWAAGASLTAADMILSGDTDIAFTPSGGFHHAMKDRASGFCYVNDVVLAVLRLIEAGRRVLFLDVDAHHGDGVQAAFYDRSDVMAISVHESGKTLFPWTTGFVHEIGEGPGLGYNVNVPVPAETYDDAYLDVLREIVFPVARAYSPDVLVVELGLDTLKGDPLTHLHLSNNYLVDLVRWILALGVPVILTGGGGYHVENTVRGWALAWQSLCGEEDQHDLALGLGGTLLQSTEWAGGLRDHAVAVSSAQRAAVEPAVREVIAQVKSLAFPRLGLESS